MTGARGFITVFLLCSAITMLVIGFSDKVQKQKALCDLSKLDACARTGGSSR